MNILFILLLIDIIVCTCVSNYDCKFEGEECVVLSPGEKVCKKCGYFDLHEADDCENGEDCCSGVCGDSGTCSCSSIVPGNNWCEYDSDCCDGYSCTEEKCCSDDGSACETSMDCCSGKCDETEKTCVPKFSMEDDSLCNANDDCVSEACVNHKCESCTRFEILFSDECLSHTDCCSRRCIGGECFCSTHHDGENWCSEDSDCCHGDDPHAELLYSCISGKCCIEDGKECFPNSCCDGFECDEKTKVCAMKPPTGVNLEASSSCSGQPCFREWDCCAEAPYCNEQWDPDSNSYSVQCSNQYRSFAPVIQVNVFVGVFVMVVSFFVF